MIKVGIVGFGYAAQTFHVPLLVASEQFDIVAVVSSKPEAVSAKLPAAIVYSDVDQLLAQCELDLVVITAPNALHCDLACQCLQANINVVIEKPIVTNAEEMDRLLKAEASSQAFVSGFHNRRWDGDFLTVKKLLAENAVGDLRLYESHFDRFRPFLRQRWREQPGAGAGLWFDLGSHLTDQALQLFGTPNAVTGRCLVVRENAEVTDYFHVQLHYKNLEVVLHGSCLSAAPNARFRLEGYKGTYIQTGLDPQEDQLKSGLNPLSAGYGQFSTDAHGQLYNDASVARVVQETGCYQLYYAAIADAVLHGGKVPVPLSEMVAVMKVLVLAEESSALGRSLDF